MIFNYNKPNHGLTDEEIIEDVIRVKEELNKDSLLMREYFARGKYGKKAIWNHFGSWNNLLDMLGLQKTRINEHLSKEEIFEIIEQLWLDLGHQPTLRDFEERTHHTKKIIIRNFGSWLECLRAFCDFKETDESGHSNNVALANEHITPREPSLSLRYKVLKRDNFKCVICGKAPSTHPGIELHIDHIRPYSLGGETTLDNLQTLCQNCNLGKSDDA